MLSLFKRKPKTPPPPPIKIAGIYTICNRLRLPKGWATVAQWPEGKPMSVAMESGKTAIYRYAGPESASNVDWVWHVFNFDRYAEDGEHLDMVRY